MNKREARRWAWFHGAAVIRNAIESGWELEKWVDNDADLARIETALEELIRGMERKGGRR